MADKLRRQMQEIALGIEEEVINLPYELCEEAFSETRFSLVVKPVNPKKQNLRAMLGTLPRLWGVGDEVTGRILENKKIQFLFQSEESMTFFLRRGPWSFNEWMCVTQRWNPSLIDDDLKRIPFWIQIRGIPLHLLTLRMITSIGGRMGHFLETDFGGDNAVLVDYVRVRILWNIDDPLRFQRPFQFGDETSVLKFRYEKLRNFCSTCGLLTHVGMDCPMNNDIQPPPPSDDENDDDPDYNPEAPMADQQEDTQKLGVDNVADSGKHEDTSGSSKKRKMEPSGAPEHIHVFPLVCCDVRQTRTTEDTDLQVCKCQRRQSEIIEGRAWYLMQQVPSPQPTEAGRSTPNAPTTNCDGTVGHKPPELP